MNYSFKADRPNMTNKKNANSKQNKSIKRRHFIKYAGVSSLLSGSIASSVLYAENKRFAENNTSLANGNTRNAFGSLEQSFIYLNSGTEGSMPNSVQKTFQQALAQWASNPTYCYELDPVFGKRQLKNREILAQYLATGMNNLCLTDNTTMGLNMVLLGLNFTQHERVIITDHEHHGLVSPLSVQQQKVGIQIIERAFPTIEQLKKMNAEQLIDHLFPNTKQLRGAAALCVSHVYPTTGTHLPLRLLRKKADQLGIKYLVVDGAQAFAMFDLTKGDNQLKYTDFYAAPGHKWLNGPPGSGFLYLNNDKIQPPEFFPVMSQRMPRYLSDGKIEKTNYPMAKALQIRGSSNVPGFVGMMEAINFIKQLGGFSQVEDHILSNSRWLAQQIKKQSEKALVSPIDDAKLSSGLLVFRPFSWNQPNKVFTDQKTAKQVVDALLEKNIQIRFIGFHPAGDNSGKKDYVLRVSSAVFTSRMDLKVFLKALQVVLSKL